MKKKLLLGGVKLDSKLKVFLRLLSIILVFAVLVNVSSITSQYCSDKHFYLLVEGERNFLWEKKR